ncbi:class I SAM-dependent methyltransferase [Paenactinomyces guangxiensis]|uniref:Methyltransferase domain-containing protein n=1 Tax=Paenactinomyces guangxiensis TaxID=1490290 RepID=A0A7W2A8D5_9BACL|nr:class I SAM-dependent methyltransferase [Paenactinomyces guangxiensis]MBA4493713.1 methyltransferase domain-containing protein [Paenactinomyces guangxiensis]MBH8591000.1 methyltransferase domain-containing protein [Paenactinomyces guangxiensis]
MPQWYEESFGEDYLLVYKHRNRQNASFEAEQITRWLQLSKQDLILDLCCGTGRHTIALGRNDFRVVGLDLSKTLLSHAVSESAGLPIPFVHGDMRTLPFMDHSFEVVLNLFTSFGYFTQDRDNQQVLAEINRVLKPEGRFLIDFMNPESVKRKLVPVSEREEQGIHIREERKIAGDFVLKEIWVRDDKGERHYQERVKMYSMDRMEAMMEQAGLTIEQVYGNFRGEPYQTMSDRMIFLGRVYK